MNNNTEGLTRFVESGWSRESIIKAETEELRESMSRVPTKLRESVEQGAAEGWWVPISYYNKINGNNRNYNKKLWSNVRDNQKDAWLGSYMLDDHPEGDSDGKPGQACGIWLDMKLGEPDMTGVGLVYGLLVPATRKGKDLEDVLRKGGKVGTSSSGFGKLMRDGVTVDPETFQIERLADWVLNPSQGTFFAYDESEDDITDRSIRESTENTESILTEETTTNINKNSIKEKVVKDSKITKLEEKKFRRDMESFLESANGIKDPQERLEEFKEIREYLEDGACPDLKEQVEKKISESEEYIKTALREKMELEEELDIKSPKDLKEKLSKISGDFQIIEKESKDWKKIAEALQKKYSKTKAELEKRSSAEYVEYLKKKNEKLAAALKAQTEKASKAINDITASYKEACENVKRHEESIETLNAEKTELDKQLEEACEYKKVAKYLKKENDALKESNQKHMDAIKKLYDVAGKQRVKIEESAKEISKLQSLNESVNKSLQEAGKKNLQYEAKLLRQIKKSAPKKELNAVEEYYESLYNQYGDEIVPFRAKIVGKKTLNEAKQFFFKNILQNLSESEEIDNMRIPESLSIDPMDRAEAMGISALKSSMMDRKPEGWR